ncbi:bifunctional N(6)-L-threonylcarbamoyladenine synthase/serine/threonine protein kinase [Halodesulfurarchaeum sp. HSR-GB]|nr:bifunctional N(6)-L-threonylcarbamoyladenine synthase/serine/threonine protein kinase [Halodesulfurarchaeum sp. HSR-GB]MDR5656296.1 bifunctional N(6)-L-threonylcarbamoyladenine synthase/serine/threonine protein kinase [Halodesulfurarchaeum sp. HSR-GB]
MTRILGIEGTAWAASAAVYDDTTDQLFVESDAYQPASGGIHPREAAEHMRSAIPEVIETALDQAEGPIDAVAFSRGPGLGPCLRIVGTAARSLAGTLDVPLVGVNHMVAHLEIGRHRSGFDSPICLNASGANAHVLGFRNGRYRVLGETMDTGVGNAIDKFTRHVGWSHPGGPKVEEAAMEGSYVDLPYVVKGMDFSFSGIMSAAKDAYDEGVPVEDVSYALQETIFAMLTEVAERALSLTGRNELVLGGGVGQNKRLREMLQEMADQRGASFYAPEPALLRDNAGMIAVLGATMYEAGDTISIADSGIDADFRPDQVPVTWRSETIPERGDRTGSLEGAEAVVEIEGETVRKRRRPKSYRHPTLDERLRRDRTVQEVRLTHEARTLGVPTPIVRDVDLAETTIVFERVGERDLRDALSPDRARSVGSHLAKIHAGGFVHGDPTVRNVRVREGEPETVLIDFGLGYYTDDVEDYAMDLHVFEQSLAGTADDPAELGTAAERGYAEVGDSAVIDRLREIEARGRYQ